MQAKGRVRTTKGSVVYPRISRALAKLGEDISLARRKRRMPAEEFARRMGVSRATLHRLEKGDPGVSLNTLTMAMFVLGRLDTITDLADPAKDDVGMMLSRQAAPRRVRAAKGSRQHKQDELAEETQQAPKPSSGGGMGW